MSKLLTQPLHYPKVGLLAVGNRPWKRIVELAQTCEQLGFDEFWIADERFFRDVYSLLSAVAVSTTRVLVGPCVTDPYTRHPALTAAALASLDEISGGRAVLGIGAGASGFRQLGIRPRRPAAAITEAVQLIRALVRGDDIDFIGDFFRFSGRLDFRPQRRSIRTYVAAGGPLVQEAAGAIADGVILQAQMTAVELTASIERVRRGAARAGRDPDDIELVARIDVAVDEQIEAAYDALRHRVARIVARSSPGFVRIHDVGLSVSPEMAKRAKSIPYTHDPELLRPLAELVPDEFVDAFCIAATPASLGERIALPASYGITHLIIHPIPVSRGRVEPVLQAVSEWRLAEVRRRGEAV